MTIWNIRILWRALRDNPKISVLMAAYNAETYVGAAVESVLSQTYDDFELLIIDDGSTDQTSTVLREFAQRDPRIKVLSRENKGLVVSLNQLISIARGSYLARMDADDICRRERFEKQIRYLNSHSDCLAVGCSVLFIDLQGEAICEVIPELIHEEIDAGHMSGVPSMRLCHPSVMMRRDPVVKIGGYREQFSLAEDLDLFLRLAELGRLANLPEVLFEYRQHFSSLCYSQYEDSTKAAKRAVQDACKRRGMAAFEPKQPDPKAKPETRADIHRKWAWWALSANNVATARKHATMAFARNPINLENLRVLACAIRGH